MRGFHGGFHGGFHHVSSGGPFRVELLILAAVLVAVVGAIRWVLGRPGKKDYDPPGGAGDGA